MTRAADSWASSQPALLDADDEEGAALALYNLALDFQERSQQSEASLIEQFEESAARVTPQLGDLIIVDDEDERLVLGGTGRFRAEVLPEDASGEWRELSGGDELVEFYDPTDVFGDLADALAEAFPSIAPDTAAAGGGAEAVEDAVAAEDVEDQRADDGDESRNGRA